MNPVGDLTFEKNLGKKSMLPYTNNNNHVHSYHNPHSQLGLQFHLNPNHPFNAHRFCPSRPKKTFVEGVCYSVREQPHLFKVPDDSFSRYLSMGKHNPVVNNVLWKTKMCTNKRCSKGNSCPFGHSYAELRVKLCRFGRNCKFITPPRPCMYRHECESVKQYQQRTGKNDAGLVSCQFGNHCRAFRAKVCIFPHSHETPAEYRYRTGRRYPLPGEDVLPSPYDKWQTKREYREEYEKEVNKMKEVNETENEKMKLLIKRMDDEEEEEEYNKNSILDTDSETEEEEEEEVDNEEEAEEVDNEEEEEEEEIDEYSEMQELEDLICCPW